MKMPSSLRVHSSIATLDARLTLLYLAFILYSLSYILSYTTIKFGPGITLLQITSLALLLISILMRGFHSSHELFRTILLCAVVVLATVTTKERGVLFLGLFVVFGSDMSIKALAKIVFIEELLVILIVAVLSEFNVIETVYQAREGFGLRSSMGFSHPNRFGSNVLALCISFAILRYPKFGLLDILIAAVLTVIVAVLSDSRTSELMIVFVPVFSGIIYVVSTKIHKPSYLMLCLVITLICIIAASYYLMVSYDASVSWMSSLNDFLSGRLNLAHSYYETYGIELFGRPYSDLLIQVGTRETLMIDNAYVFLLMVYGLIPTIAILGLYIWLFVSNLSAEVLPACIFGAFLYGCVGFCEVLTIDIAMNYCLIAAGAFLENGFRKRVCFID